jgi:hypothetical protein
VLHFFLNFLLGRKIGPIVKNAHPFIAFGEANAELHAKHHCFMGVFVISNPKLGAGVVWIFSAAYRTMAHNARDACLSELLADFGYLQIIGGVVQKFHTRFCGY